MHPLYLTQHPSGLIENIHQYISMCVHEMYLVRFFPLRARETPEAKKCLNPPNFTWNPTGLISCSSRTLDSWNTTNIASILSENYFSGWFPTNGDTRCMLKDKIV